MDQSMLITYLIRQDMRWMQLLRLLEKEGRDIENFYPDVMKTVGLLMGLPEHGISDLFVDIYRSFMDEAEKVSITGDGHLLAPLAGKCYEVLRCWVEVEKKEGNNL